MSTIEDLRTALNAAAHTDALSSEEVLRQGRRYRTRRTLAAAAGTAALAVIAGAGFSTFTVAAQPDQAGITAAAAAPTAPATPATTAAPAQQRYTFEKETLVEKGVYSTVIVDKSLPGDLARVAFVLHREPGNTKLPEPGESTGPLTAGGVTVQVETYQAEAGTSRQLTWVANDTMYALQAYAVRAGDGTAYVPTDEELRNLVQHINATFAGRR